jgi:hypothetical protein
MQSQEIKSIKRSVVLAEIERKEDSDGKQKSFSIKFCTKEGKVVFLSKAVSSGLRYKMKKFRHRSVMPVDNEMNQCGHVYPVNIDYFLEFNKMEVNL